MNILILDDHVLFRAGLRLLLKTLDRSVITFEAGTADEALVIADRHPELQLCLLDLNLRQEQGLCLLARIKTAAPDIAVIIISACEEPAMMRACIDAGAMSYIPKSSTPEQLASALQCVLGGVVYLPSALLDGSMDTADKPLNLSQRQLDVLRGLCKGLSTKAIARELALSDHTVKDYIAALYKLLDVHNRTEAVIKTGRLRVLPELH